MLKEELLTPYSEQDTADLLYDDYTHFHLYSQKVHFSTLCTVVGHSVTPPPTRGHHREH